MKSTVVSMARMAALVLLLGGCAATPVARNQPPVVEAPAQGPHPQIVAAISALQEARDHLDRASHNFGGHREEALKAVDEAIGQLQICMQY
jgi:hypothetical protein